MRDDLIYGIHVIQRLLQAKPEKVLEVFLATSREDKQIQSILLLCRQYNITVHALARKKLESWLPSLNHQGIAARIRSHSLLNEQHLIELLQQHSNPLLLVLDGLQDPHNLGACLRTADAANVTAVIIPKHKGVTLTPTVRKVASGAAETVPLVEVTNLARCLKGLKEHGVWVVGSSVNASQSLYQVDLKEPLAIILGAEGAGIRRLTEEHCDILMHIPMLGVLESLNVSVAAGVCLFEAVRQRSGDVSKEGSLHLN